MKIMYRYKKYDLSNGDFEKDDYKIKGLKIIHCDCCKCRADNPIILKAVCAKCYNNRNNG